MDDFTNTVRTGARELAEQIMPAPVAAVRIRGEQLRRKRTVGSIAVAAAGVAVIGTTAFATFGSGGNHTGATILPGSTGTGTPAPTLSTPSVAPSTSSSSAGAPNPTPIHTPTESSHASSSQSQSQSQSTPTACDAAGLAITSSPWTGRTGHMIGIFLFHNTSSTTCRISGYPHVSGVNEQGATTTVATHTLTGWAGNLSSVPTVDVPPGGYASAGVEWTNSTDDGSACALVSTFEVAPPSGGATTKIAAGKQSATDGPACAKFKIHPVVAGFDPSYFYPPYNPPVTSGK